MKVTVDKSTIDSIKP